MVSNVLAGSQKAKPGALGAYSSTSFLRAQPPTLFCSPTQLIDRIRVLDVPLHATVHLVLG